MFYFASIWKFSKIKMDLVMSAASCFFLLIFFLQPALAEPAQGGFFDKEYLDKGFFTDDEKQPEANQTGENSKSELAEKSEKEGNKEIPPTVQPTSEPTPPRVSNTDVAREIISSGTSVTDTVKNIQNNPQIKNKLLQSLQGVKENLNSQLKISPSSQTFHQPAPSLVPPEDLLADYPVYNGPARISVVVKAEPRSTFLRTLDKIYMAVNQRKAVVERLFVIGQNKDLVNFIPDRKDVPMRLQFGLSQLGISQAKQSQIISAAQEAIPNSQILIEKLSLKRVRSRENLNSLIQKFGIESSPAWSVSSGDTQILIQGEIDPREFLTEQGTIATDLRENTLGGSPFIISKDRSANSVTEFYFDPPEVKEEEKKLVLPICTRARIRRMQVGPATLSSFFSPVMLIYSPDSPEQLEQSEKYQGTKIAYSSGNQTQADPLLPFILSQPLRCLPTRMQFVNENGRQFVEFRQGEAAWRD